MTGDVDLPKKDGDQDLAEGATSPTSSTLWVPADVAADREDDRAAPGAAIAWVPIGASSRRFGRAMQTLAVFGVVVAVVAGIVTWVFLGDLEKNVDRSLVIGADVAVTLSETIDVADALIVTLDDGLATISAMTETIGTTIDNVSGVADAAADLATTIPETFVDIDAALLTVEELGATVDNALSALSNVPFGPDYNPEVPFPQAIANLRSSLDPLGEQLSVIGEELSGFSENSGSLTEEVDRFVANIAASREALDDTQELLDSYRVAADDARDLAIQGREDLDVSITWIRLVVVLLALLIAAGQIVPWWLGSRLVEADSPPQGPPLEPPVENP
jgi:hypothetical protein